jgi:hypothetical protein
MLGVRRSGRLLVALASLVLTACAAGLTPRQTLTWDAFKTCQAEGPSAKLERVRPDGSWHVEGVEGEAFRVHRCMQTYWEQAARDNRVPTAAATTPGARVLAPTWSRGDEWSFASEGPSGTSRSVWTVDREELVDGVAHYVVRTGSRQVFYRKSDLAASHETLDGAVVVRHRPHRVRYLWPLTVGATWEQSYRREQPLDRRSVALTELATVDREEMVTVPAGTFRALRIVYRRKAGGAVTSEEWYAPEVGMTVRVHERLETGSRVRELTAYRRRGPTVAGSR